MNFKVHLKKQNQLWSKKKTRLLELKWILRSQGPISNVDFMTRKRSLRPLVRTLQGLLIPCPLLWREKQGESRTNKTYY